VTACSAVLADRQLIDDDSVSVNSTTTPGHLRVTSSCDDELRHNSTDDVITAAPPTQNYDSDRTDDDDDDDDEWGTPTEQRLMRRLLGRYERAVRPVHDARETVIVRMGLTLTQIFNMVSRHTIHSHSLTSRTQMLLGNENIAE